LQQYRPKTIFPPPRHSGAVVETLEGPESVVLVAVRAAVSAAAVDVLADIDVADIDVAEHSKHYHYYYRCYHYYR
jgi:hypothetical protein